MHSLVRATFLLLLASGLSDAYNILIWMPLGSKSHFNPVKPLARELALRNNSVTFVAPVEDKELSSLPGMTFVPILIDMDSMIHEVFDTEELFEGDTGLQDVRELLAFQKNTTRMVMESPEWPRILDTQWDVVVADPLIDAGVYLAKRVFNTSLAMFNNRHCRPCSCKTRRQTLGLRAPLSEVTVTQHCSFSPA